MQRAGGDRVVGVAMAAAVAVGCGCAGGGCCGNYCAILFWF